VRSLLSALLSLLVSCFAISESAALDEAYKRCLERQLRFIIAKNPPYSAGGASDLEKGLDCSGYVFLACKWAGIPGVKRTTSFRMAMGLDGWTGKDIPQESCSSCDLAFWTWHKSLDRPYGHVGVFLKAGPRLEVAHASSKRGVVLAPLRGSLQTDLSKVRCLTIGE